MKRVYPVRDRTLLSQKGFSLIEVLIAIVVLALGLIGIIKFQGQLIEGGSASRERTVAAQLAEEKLEDLRGIVFSTTNFKNIADDVGGTIVSGATTVSNVQYTLSWFVGSYIYPTTNTPAIWMTTTMLATGATPDYKKVRALVKWVDQNGENQSVVVTSVIGDFTPGEAVATLTSPVSIPSPVIMYVTGTNLNISTEGETVESTSPKPGIAKHGSSEYFFTTFETFTFTATNVTRREEFMNIECRCQFTNDALTGSGFPVAHVVWNSSLEPPAREDFFSNERVTKPTAAQDVSGPAQDPFCTECCNDHHDTNTGEFACDPNTPAGRANCYDPWRPAAEYHTSGVDQGDHKHYNSSSSSEVVISSTTGSPATKTYLEACRFKRIDGVFRVFQDWHLHQGTYAVALVNDFENPDYETYIQNYLFSYADRTAAGGNDSNCPAQSESCIVNPLSGNIIFPSSIVTSTLNSGTTQLSVRGLYIDYLTSAHLVALGATSFPIADVLENIPFVNIELADLSNWGTAGNDNSVECDPSGGDNFTSKLTNGGSASTDVANTQTDLLPFASSTTNCITDKGLNALASSENSSNINRGRLTLSTPTSGTPFSVNARITLSNTGLTDGINKVGVSPPAPSNIGSTLQEPSAGGEPDRTDDRDFVKKSAPFN